MNIPDEAVEAAMLAQYASERGRDEWVPFAEMPHEFLTRYRANALLVIEAAAPYLQSPAWLEGYKAGELDGAYGTNEHEPPNQRNPFKAAK